jgi:hypothetical protein
MTTKGKVFTKLLAGLNEFVRVNCDPSMMSRMTTLDEETIKILLITQVKANINDDQFITNNLPKLQLNSLSNLSTEKKARLKQYIVALCECC